MRVFLNIQFWVISLECSVAIIMCLSQFYAGLSLLLLCRQPKIQNSDGKAGARKRVAAASGERASREGEGRRRRNGRGRTADDPDD